ncbi:MAG: hypothetical protein JNM27_07745 [Leptospirales bacterium]|nr:hypothetical protein [Leptospirales bacterium]
MNYQEPDLYERIDELNKIKLQRFIAWLTEKELVALMKAVDQHLEDAILDNCSKTARSILLQDLGFDETAFEKRAVVRRQINKVYMSLLEQREQAPTKKERQAMLAEAVQTLSSQDREIYESRFKTETVEISEALRNRLRGYLAVLERGGSLNLEPES